MSSSIATVAHISDLHFIEELTAAGRRLSFVGPKSHGFHKVYALASAFFELREIRKRRIDVVLVTGDVTTEGSPGAFRTALEFLEQDNIYRYTPGRRVCGGLGLGPRQRIAVPGNHDRFGGRWEPIPRQEGGELFEDILKTPRQYPYAVGYRRDDSPSEEAVIFFVFDSTLVEDGRRDFWNAVARGRIELGESARLKEIALEIRRSSRVAGLCGEPINVDYDRCVRVALLHHHPVYPTGVTHRTDAFNRAVAKVKAGVSLMENARAFIDACFEAEVDLVLFGHQHKKYENILFRPSARTTSGRHTVHFVCCPSTTEFSEVECGFNIMELRREGFSLEHYKWTGSASSPGIFAPSVQPVPLWFDVPLTRPARTSVV